MDVLSTSVALGPVLMLCFVLGLVWDGVVLVPLTGDATVERVGGRAGDRGSV